MAMFPLGSPLFPGAAMPLQVFEPRYRAMMRYCLANEPVFGIALITRGREVGGGDQRSTVATAARIEQIAEWPDGRFSLVAVGFQRLRVKRWLADDPFPWAEVEDWAESTEPVAPGVVAEVEAKLAALHALAERLGLSVPALPKLALVGDLAERSYLAASFAPMESHDRQRLLCADGPSLRWPLLGEMLDEQAEILRFRAGGEAI